MSAKQFQPKTKLRTASDVISRLKWSTLDESKNESFGQVFVGYIDRINGPMEKPVEDFASINSGGEIPEHRIIYFRTSKDDANPSILWDRSARIDRIFGSGEGKDGETALETKQAVKQAKETMARLESERADRRAIKAKERARKALKKQSAAAFAASNGNSQENNEEFRKEPNPDRFLWMPMPWYSYENDAEKWNTQNQEGKKKVSRDNVGSKVGNPSKNTFSVATWNVLFDLFDSGQTNEDSAETRWQQLANVLCQCDADLIVLQEATPNLVKVLLSMEWIQKGFMSSASPSNYSTVDPCGVLLLWRLDTFSASFPKNQGPTLSICRDNGRHRSLVAALTLDTDTTQNSTQNHVILLANVHLPADAAIVKTGKSLVDKPKNSSRSLARKRELAAIIGQLQRIEKRMGQRHTVHPIIVGDFNCEPTDLLDGSFAGYSNEHSGYFVDIWPLIGEGPGYTFDPNANPRAARNTSLVLGKKHPRRIDRMYVVGTSDSTGGGIPANLTPTNAELVGLGTPLHLPPSDHFGMRAEMQILSPSSNSNKFSLFRPIGPTFSLDAWSANAVPTTDYMLAILIDDQVMEQWKHKYDSQSSLLVPHIVLLHGFIEMFPSCQELALRAIRESIMAAAAAAPPAPTQLSPNLEFDTKKSFQVFEHRLSATLVATPTMNSDGGAWLQRLYNELRMRFRLCTEQEQHSEEGWVPHVSLGKFGSALGARNALSDWLASLSSSESWGAKVCIPIRKIDVLARRGTNGTFQSIASVSTIVSPSMPRSPSEYLNDAGCKSSMFWKECAQTSMSVMERACRLAAKKATKTAALGNDGDNELLDVSLHLTGSSWLGVGLPRISDCDGVIMLKASGDLMASSDNEEKARKSLQRIAADPCSFFDIIVEELKALYPGAKARTRPAAVSDSEKLDILTVAFSPSSNFPSVDLLLCLFDKTQNIPMNKASVQSWGAIADGDLTIRYIDTVATNAGLDPLFLKKVYSGAVRIIKLWAHARGIYGAQSGFLGGGGWSVFVARLMCDAITSKTLSFEDESEMQEADQAVAAAARKVACHFFVDASKWPWPKVVTLHDTQTKKSEASNDAVAGDNGNYSTTTKRDALFVESPSKCGLHGRNSTKSIQMAIADELRFAASKFETVTKQHDEQLESVLHQWSVAEFISSFESVVVLELKIADGSMEAVPINLNYWGASQFIFAILKLEFAVGAAAIRPWSKVLRLHHNEWISRRENEEAESTEEKSGHCSFGFVWIAGLRCCSSLVKSTLANVEESAVASLGNEHLLRTTTEQKVAGTTQGQTLAHCALYALESEDAILCHIP